MSLTRGVLSNADAHAVVLTRQLNAATRETCLDIVAGQRPNERNVIAVTCDLTADQFADRWSDCVGAFPDTYGIVDVGSRTASTDSEVDAAHLEVVPHPSDLQQLRDAVEGRVNQWPNADRTVVYLDSVNALLDHVTIPSVTQFLDRLTSSLSSLGATSCASFETGNRGERTVRPVTETFGTVFEVGRLGRCLEPVADHPSADVVFDVLSSRWQRLALRNLLRSDGTLHVRELAERIAAAETDDRPEIERVFTRLHHIDLPKLEDAGLVTVEDRTVSATEAVTAVEPHLALIHPEEGLDPR
jgi:DNA-binding HxlR family transcriptional regulator